MLVVLEILPHPRLQLWTDEVTASRLGRRLVPVLGDLVLVGLLGRRRVRLGGHARLGRGRGFGRGRGRGRGGVDGEEGRLLGAVVLVLRFLVFPLLLLGGGSGAAGRRRQGDEV